MDMFYRIKCSNGQYVSKTCNGTWISYTKNGKIWTSENLASKNFEQCLEFVEGCIEKGITKYSDLKFELEITE